MADYQSNVELKLTGDATQLNTTLEQSKSDVAKAGSNIQSTMGKSGKDAGEKFGQQLFQAQKKWLTLSQDLLRKYGGSVGRVLADVLGQFDKFREAQRATAQAAIHGAGGFGGTFGGEVVGNVAGGHLAGRSATKGISKQLLTQQAAILGGSVHPSIMAIAEAGNGASRFSKVLTGVRTASIGAASAIGGALATALIVIAGGFMLAANRSREFKKEVETFKSKLLVEEINAITDPVEKTARILEAFGSDGQKKFRELQLEVDKFNKKLEDQSGWRTLGTIASITTKALKDAFLDTFGTYYKKVWDFVAWFPKQYAKAVATVAGINEDLVNNLVEGQARVESKQEELDRKRKERAEREKNIDVQIATERNKLAEELLSTESKLHIINVQIDTLKQKQKKSKEDELRLAQLITAQLQAQKQIEEAKRAAFTKTPEQRAKEFASDVSGILNPTSPTALGNQMMARALGEQNAKTAAGISLGNEINRINYQRNALGLPSLSQLQRMDLATHRMIQQQAAGQDRDPMELIAESFRQHGALIVKPVFSK